MFLSWIFLACPRASYIFYLFCLSAHWSVSLFAPAHQMLSSPSIPVFCLPAPAAYHFWAGQDSQAFPQTPSWSSELRYVRCRRTETEYCVASGSLACATKAELSQWHSFKTSKAISSYSCVFSHYLFIMWFLFRYDFIYSFIRHIFFKM